MRCHACEESAIISQQPRCKQHFIEEFEARVKHTIERFELIRPGQKIAVAASGGKDSLTILHLLKKWYGDVTAIAIDEGIEGYRAKTLSDLRRACEKLGVPLIIKTYEEVLGRTLDDALKERPGHACILCGTMRRHLISIASKGFDVLATGHNADDEAQTILMNLLRGNTDLLPRSGPKTGVGAVGFVQRVKPLYFCSEKEVMTYAYLHGFVSEFIECPNAKEGYRRVIRDEFNRYLKDDPGARERLLESFLALKETFPHKNIQLASCQRCGEPSALPTCKACQFVAQFTA